MKIIPFSEVVERESSGILTRLFSSRYTYEDQVFTWYEKDLSFSQRKSEIEKMNSYVFKIITHLYMIYFPAKGYESEEYIMNNKNDIHKQWFVPITKGLQKCKLRTSVLYTNFDRKFYEDLYDELWKHHKYNRMLTIKKDKIEFIWSIFTNEWDNLLALHKYKKLQIEKEDYLNIYNKINKLL